MTEGLKAPLSAVDCARGFVSLARRTVRGQWAYRGATLMGLASSSISYVVLLLIWKRVYAGTDILEGYTVERLLSYLAVAFILNVVLSLMVEVRFGSRLQTGTIAFDLLRPLGCMPLHLAQAMGEACGGGVIAALLYAVAWAVFGSDVLPPDTECFVLGLSSVGLALLLNFAIGYLAAQSLFITLHYYGVTQGRAAMHHAFSGLAAPVELFPPGLQSVASVLPFRHVIETPVLIGLGRVPRALMPALLLQQAAWAAGLSALALALFHVGYRRHQLQGG